MKEKSKSIMSDEVQREKKRIEKLGVVPTIRDTRWEEGVKARKEVIFDAFRHMEMDEPLFVRPPLRHTPSSKARISESLKGYKHSINHNKHISWACKGHKLSEETKQKMSEAKSNMSEETKQKISEGTRGKGNGMWGKRCALNPKFGKKYPKKKPQEVEPI